MNGMRRGFALICAILYMLLAAASAGARESAPANPKAGSIKVVVATPEPVIIDLSPGARGDEVLRLQQRLAELGFFYTAEDGIFGANTQNAVCEFENYIRLLEQDEIDRIIEANKTPEPTVSPTPAATAMPEPAETMTADGTSEAVQTPTPVITPSPTPAPTPATPVDGIADKALQKLLYGDPNDLYRRDAGLNDKGADVLRIQRRLVRLNYLNDEPDGVYGINTENAVKAFQMEHNMNATGVADQAAQSILYSIEAIRAERPVYNLLYLGVTGEDVKAVQNHLRLLGFTNSKASGTYDAKTQEAVMRMETYLHELEMAERGITSAPAATAVPDDVLENQGEIKGDPENNPYEVLPDEPAEQPTTTEVPNATANPEASAAMNETAEPDAAGAGVEETSAPDEADEENMMSEESDSFVPTGIVTAEMQTILLEEGIPVYLKTVQKGDSGDEVRRVQRRLYSLGYLTANGVDGIYGKRTEAAVIDFQRRNKLEQTGIANREVQTVLFSEDAIKGMKTYQIKISVEKQRVYVYTYDEKDQYSVKVKEFICSTGTKDHATPLGTFTNTGPGARWHYFKKFECWAQYAYYIDGDIMFHSVLYDEQDEDTLRKGSVSQLGKRASHGCVRLQVEDAAWIYNNCKAGTTVIVY